MSDATQDRRPLPGWRDLPPPNDLCRAELGPLMVSRSDFGRGRWLWEFEWSDGNANGWAPTREAAMIAAEDGARALVAGLAAVLGLKVVPA